MRNPCTATKSSPCLQQPEKARAQQRRPRLSLSSTSCCSECGPWSSSSSTPWELVAAKSLQPCPTLCDPIDGSLPGSSVPGILQARILEWIAISFSNACMHAKSIQSWLTLCDPMDSSPLGSSVHGILQARVLEWVAMSFSQLRLGAAK